MSTDNYHLNRLVEITVAYFLHCVLYRFRYSTLTGWKFIFSGVLRSLAIDFLQRTAVHAVIVIGIVIRVRRTRELSTLLHFTIINVNIVCTRIIIVYVFVVRGRAVFQADRNRADLTGVRGDQPTV